MSRIRILAVAMAFFVALSALGCGSSSPLLITGALPPAGTVGLAYSGTLTASAGTGTYTWIVNGLPAGLTVTGTSSATLTVSGIPTTPGTYEVTASVADSNSRVDSYTSGIAVSTSPALTINGSLPFTGVVGTLYSGSVSATGGTPPYSWVIDKLPPGVTASGENTPVLSVSGTPTTDGAYNVSITLSDSKGATQNASLTIAIDAASDADAADACNSPVTPRGSEAALTLPYAFLLNGITATGIPVAWSGSFTPDGLGGIAQLDVDSISATDGPHSYRIDLNTSSYSLGADGSGCLSFAIDGDNSPAPPRAHHQPNPNLADANSAARFTLAPESSSHRTTILLAFTVDLAHKTGVISESNAPFPQTAITGQLRQRVPSDFPRSDFPSRFAFGLEGWFFAESDQLERAGMAGSFLNTAGTLSGGTADINMGGIPSGELRNGVGVLSAPTSATGRGTGAYAIDTPNGPFAFDFAYYAIDHSNFYFISTDAPIAGNFILSGQAAAAEISTPLNGRYIAALTGLDPESARTHLGTNILQFGLLQASIDSASTALNLFTNHAGKILTTTSTNITATLDPSTGRATFSNFGTIAPVAYLTAPSAENSVAAFLVGTDSASTTGVLIPLRAPTAHPQ